MDVEGVHVKLDASGRPLPSPEEVEEATKRHSEYMHDLFELMNGLGPINVEDENRFREKYGEGVRGGGEPPEWMKVFKWETDKQIWAGGSYGWMDWDLWEDLIAFDKAASEKES